MKLESHAPGQDLAECKSRGRRGDDGDVASLDPRPAQHVAQHVQDRLDPGLPVIHRDGDAVSRHDHLPARGKVDRMLESLAHRTRQDFAGCSRRSAPDADNRRIGQIELEPLIVIIDRDPHGAAVVVALILRPSRLPAWP